MSHSVPLIRSTLATHPFARAAGGVTAFLAGLAREIRVQRALHQIDGMDDRLLADIGIGHGQAESAVRHGRDRAASTGVVPAPASARLDLGRGWTEWR